MILQNAFPLPADGHFTVLSGAADIVSLPNNSLPLLQLQGLIKYCDSPGIGAL